ncbi:MAG TPA: hypothetical protein VLH08_03610 [Acidobacteriota bacterium]|nr:hypothetical protein [Acidobacteriota bacterium]
MPPQVVRTGDAGTPVTSQAPVTIEQPKTAEVDKSAAQKQEPPKQDAQTVAKNTEGAKKHAEGTKHQEGQRAQMKRNELDQKLPEKKNGKTATTAKPEERKTAKQSEKGAWGFVKDAANIASKAAGAGVAVLRDTTENASAVHVAEKANAHVTDGIKRTQHIALEKKGAELATELKQMSAGKPSFAESERMIQKIDQYKREVDNAGGNDAYLHGLYFQETVKPPRMEIRKFGVLEYKVKSQFQDEPVNHMKDLLGAYGYEPITATKDPGHPEGRISHYEVLDTALHNWRVSSPEQRQRLHGLSGPPVKIPKDWKTPLDAQVRQESREAHDKQITLQPEPRGNYMAPPVPRERENQTDPDIALAKGRREVVDGAANTIGAIGLPTGGAKSPHVNEPIGNTKAPHRGVPPERAPERETTPGYRSTPLRRSPQEGPVAQTEPLAQARQRRAQMELDREISVPTPRGKVNMNVGEYRNRVEQARAWVIEEQTRTGQRPERGIVGPTEFQRQEAAERFGLDPNWDRIGNPNMGRN